MKRSGPPKRDAAKLQDWQARSRAQSAQNARLRPRKGLGQGNGPLKRPASSGGAKRAARTKRPPKRWREGREGVCARCPRKSGLHPHHAIYAQHVEDAGADVWDPRNRLMLCADHHLAHHEIGVNADRVPVAVLPDRVFVFAVETLGVGAAYNYFRRYYAGDDRRLDALLNAA